MGVEVVCIECNKKFEVPLSTYKKGTVKYCSQKCHYKHIKGKSFFNSGSFLKGHKMSQDSKEKISRTMKEKKLGFLKNPSNQIGENHYLWKNENEVGMTALHDWVKLHKSKSDTCELCGEKTDFIDCANISGQYARDIDDYIWLCKKCHANYDQRGKRKVKI